MHAKKLEIQEQLDRLYIQLEKANIAYAKNQSADNEALIKNLDEAINELIDQLIEIDEVG
jgi:hypothetical protein